MNENSTPTQEDDVRQIVRLLADIAILNGDHTTKKIALLTGLCELIGAKKWVWVLRIDTPEKDTPTFAGYLNGGFTTEEFLSLSTAGAHPQVSEIEAPMKKELEHKKCHITLRLEDYDRGLWQGSEVGELAKQAGVATFISSTRPMSDTTASTVVIYRAPGEGTFSERERRIAHIILTEVGWLHTLGWPEKQYIETLPRLPKSNMVLLSLLLQGHSRKEMAELMKLSPHTIGSYIKAIYKHFDVTSQPMLMNRFIYGDGHDVISHEFLEQNTLKTD